MIGSTTGGGPNDGRRFSTLTLALGFVLLGYFTLPLLALVLAVPPADVIGSLGEPFVLRAGFNTLVAATTSTLIAGLFGVPLGLWLSRTDSRMAPLVTAVVVFPLVLPPLVGGMLLLSVFGASGLGGLTGISVSRTLVGVVLAQTFVAAPFVVLTAKSAFERVDRTQVEAAWTLGASDWRAFRRVTLPLARRGIFAGITLAFARAAGEFGATLMLAYYPRTLPVQIWVTFQGRGLDAAFPIALLLVVLAVTALAVLRFVGGGLSIWTTR